MKQGGGERIQERKSVGPVFPLTPNKPQELTFWWGIKEERKKMKKEVWKGRKCDWGKEEDDGRVHFDSLNTIALGIPLSNLRSIQTVNNTINLRPHHTQKNTILVQPSFLYMPSSQRKKKSLPAPAFDSLQGRREYKYSVGLPSRPEGLGF